MYCCRYGLVMERDFPYAASDGTCPASLLLNGPSAAYPEVVTAQEPSEIVAYQGSSAILLMQVCASCAEKVKQPQNPEPWTLNHGQQCDPAHACASRVCREIVAYLGSSDVHRQT